MRYRILGCLLAIGLANPAFAEDKKPPAGPTAEPKGTPVELVITGKKTTYTLDARGRSSAELKKLILDAQKAGGTVPEAAKIELTAVLKNTGDKPISVWIAGDSVVMTLELKGDGAVNNVGQNKVFTLEFRVAKPVEIAPGKSAEIPLTSLAHGHRNASHASYWTSAGEYELVAKLKTGVSPKPEGAEARDGYGMVTLTSAPFKLTVEAKK